MFAVGGNDIAIARMLLAAGADVNRQAAQGNQRS